MAQVVTFTYCSPRSRKLIRFHGWANATAIVRAVCPSRSGRLTSRILISSYPPLCESGSVLMSQLLCRRPVTDSHLDGTQNTITMNLVDPPLLVAGKHHDP